MTHETGKFHPPPILRDRRAICLVLIAVGSMMGLVFQAQPGGSAPVATENRVIDRVEFDGNRFTDAAYLQTVVKIAPGGVWDRDEIAKACARLAATGKFEGTPYAEAREDGGKLVLVFVVAERPFITGVDFVGNEKFKTSELLKEVDLNEGSPVSEFLIKQAGSQVERKYKEAGYYHVTVTLNEEVLRDERRVLFQVSEGPRVKIRQILFEGNENISASVLRTKIESNTYVWIFRTGQFDDEMAERDASTLKRYYVDRGYLNAQVGYRIELAENQRDLSLIFQIDEGIQHLIKSIRYEGNQVFDDVTIESLTRSSVGTPIDADILKTDRERILAHYGEQGYIYAEITTAHVFDEEDGYVHLTFQIKEGEQYRFGRIVVRGNEHTKDKVVRRELRFFPEELYDTAKVKKAERSLVETNLFSEATITPQGDTPGVRDALVDVTETQTTLILFGIGVTSNSGVIGSISLEQRNFDLFDWPRTSKEFFKGQSFRGAGQTMRLQFEPGTELTRGRIEFREPYLLDHDLGMGLGAYVFERGRDEFDERRIGGYTSFDRRFEDGLLKDWAAEIAFRVESVKISGTDWLTADEIKKDKGSNFLTSVKPTLIKDTTDSRWLPSEGYRLSFSWEQVGALGGDHSFGKPMATYDQYWTLHRDVFDRKHILQVGATAGHIVGDAPVFERFFGGGIGSIRGFDFRGISPRAGWREDGIGGDFMLLTNAQYSFPLVGETLRGVTFVDMGTVEEDFGISSWRASVGVGVRVYIKFFGPIPLAFDLGFPVATEDEDDTQIFNFSFGTTF